MTNSTKRLWVLIGAVAIFALALTAVGPVMAQGGTSGGSGQSGSSVQLQNADTLGSLVSQYNLSGNDLRQFFSLNSDLVLDPGQTVTFPAGVNVNLSGDQGQGTTGSGSTSGSGTTGSDTTAATPTVAGGASGSGTTGSDASTTPTATSGTGGAQATPVVTENANNYVTQQGDTLGKVLTAMGFSASDQGMTGSGSTGSDTTAATPTVAGGASGSGSTGSDASTTPTATSGTGGTSTNQTGTNSSATGTSGSQTGSGGATGSAVTDEQLQSFVTLNSDLSFADTPAQTVMLPAGIPQTGENQTGTATPVAGSDNNGTGAGAATSTPVAGGTSGQGQTGNDQGNSYTVQSGDTLESIARQNNVTLAQLVAANPNLLSPGQTIVIPGAQGSIPQTGSNQSQRTFVVQNGETLGQVVDRYNLGQNDARAFFAANCDVQVQAGQTVNFPASANAGGASDNGSNGTSGNTGTTGNAVQATPTATAGGTGSTDNSATAQATPTAAVGGTTGNNSGTTSGSNGTSGNNGSAGSQANTYVTQDGDTLCDVLQAMGVDVNNLGSGSISNTGSSAGTTSGNAGAAQATPTAAVGGTTGNNSGSNGTAGNSSQNDQNGQAVNSDQTLWQFVTLNRDLRFADNETVTVPAGIPQTGGSAQGTGTGNNAGTGANTSSNSSSNASGSNGSQGTVQRCGSAPEAPAGYGYYRVTGADSLTSLSQKFGVDVSRIIELNPSGVYPGAIILLPGVEAPGAWNVQALRAPCAPGEK